MYMLEKKCQLYRTQFESFMLDLYGDHRLDRISMDMDAIIFRIKYMTKHGKDLDKIPEMKNEFITLAKNMRKCFSDFMFNFICKVIKIDDPFKTDDIVDIIAKDVKIEPDYVTFEMGLISENKEFLEYIDGSYDENVPYNMFPNQYFRFYTDSYNDGIAKAYPELFEKLYQHKIGTGEDADVYCHNVTIQTLEHCSLQCLYCYQFNKCPTRMTFDIAKQFIDDLVEDKYGYVNQYNSPAIILEFIGGEPLLEIKQTRRIYEYFLDRCYELNHPWFTMHRLSVCSNGLQYFDKEVQDFFKDYSSQISFNISIDGNRELHDACRIQPNGEGSYDIDMAALNHYNKHYSKERNSKMTLAPSNIKYLYDSVVDFINKGATVINVNCVFEEGWNRETAKIEYEQLKQLADYLLDNDLEHLYISIFSDRQEDVQDKYNDQPGCGGSGSMLAMRPNGQFYPCIRYMPSSVGDNVKDLCIGTVQTGLKGREQGSEILSMMDDITRRSMTTDICYECPLSNNCPNCTALGHALYGTPNKRTTFICIQRIAEVLSNIYYFNLLSLKHPEYNMKPRRNVVPKEWALLVIDEDELDYLTYIELAVMMQYMENDLNDTWRV